MTPPLVDGDCAPRFAGVREAFAASFAAGREVGASFAATVDGELVVDLWGGAADAARTRPWRRDTIVNVFSTTKAMMALSALVLADRGELDVGAPVARYWPEFAAAGKRDLPVHYLLSHRAGLAALRAPLPTEALYDWERMVRALAAETPWWEPGRACGYHALTFGFLVGELVRRVTGVSPGAFFRDEIAAPLGADFHIGLPAKEDARVAEMIPPGPGDAAPPPRVDSLLAKVMRNPPIAPGLANARAWRAAEIPGANGHTSARGVARVYGALARGGEIDGIRLLTPAAIERAIVEQSSGRDEVLTLPTRFASGFMLGMAGGVFECGPGQRTFGHPGHGGSIGFADPDARLAFGYVTNQYVIGTARHPDRRVASLVDAVYAALR